MTTTAEIVPDDQTLVDLRENSPFDRVVVHPLVLLSAVDHFNRVGNVSRNSRVIGALLGASKIIDGKRVLDISNSFAVPFDEDSRDGKVWYLDHDYLDTMFGMFRKVNAKERIIGWYHTGPELHNNDTEINDIFKKYSQRTVLCIIETTTNDWSLPARAYFCTEEVHDDGTPSTKTFNHLNVEIGAEEAEEVGVEHLCRDVFRNTQGTLSQKIGDQIKGLKGLGQKLEQIGQYLNDVASGKLPMNYKIIYGLQDIFNLLPDVASQSFNSSLQQVSNDQMLIVYLSSLIKSVVALHNLIDNKISMKETEKEDDKKEEEQRKKKLTEKEEKVKENKDETKETTEKSAKNDSEKDSDKNNSRPNTRSRKPSSKSTKKSANLQQAYETQLQTMSCKLAQLCQSANVKLDILKSSQVQNC